MPPLHMSSSPTPALQGKVVEIGTLWEDKAEISRIPCVDTADLVYNSASPYHTP